MPFGEPFRVSRMGFSHPQSYPARSAERPAFILKRGGMRIVHFQRALPHVGKPQSSVIHFLYSSSDGRHFHRAEAGFRSGPEWLRAKRDIQFAARIASRRFDIIWQPFAAPRLRTRAEKVSSRRTRWLNRMDFAQPSPPQHVAVGKAAASRSAELPEPIRPPSRSQHMNVNRVKAARWNAAATIST